MKSVIRSIGFFLSDIASTLDISQLTGSRKVEQVCTDKATHNYMSLTDCVFTKSLHSIMMPFVLQGWKAKKKYKKNDTLSSSDDSIKD